ncbi:MAG: hypothetical protein ACXVCY_08150 [Pseudobdellovibrionaceae bacterium]
MKRMMTILSLVFVSWTVQAKTDETKVLYGLSLEASLVAVEDLKAEGFNVKWLEPKVCGGNSATSGNYCVIASRDGVTKVFHNMSLEDSTKVIKDRKSEGFNAERLDSNQCGVSSSTSGEYCIVAQK